MDSCNPILDLIRTFTDFGVNPKRPLLIVNIIHKTSENNFLPQILSAYSY